MTKIIPLISSGLAGPLGVLHLPRLWLKVSLGARGKLADGYAGAKNENDLDRMVFRALELNAPAVAKFIADSRPTYPQFEAWIQRQPGVKLDNITIRVLNLGISGLIYDLGVAHLVLKTSGITSADPISPVVCDVNNSRDWALFHRAVLLEDEDDATPRSPSWEATEPMLP